MALPQDPLKSFFWGPSGAAVTPEQLAREREIANALLGQGVDTSPVGHWLEGAARFANAGAGAFRNWRASEKEAEGRSAFQDRWESIFGGGDDPVAAALAADGAGLDAIDGATSSGASVAEGRSLPPHIGPTPDTMAYRDAIASIESAGSGDYAAVGPTHPELGRALGRYQVMEANIAPWSRQVLGREITPDEFMASPEIQDAIFDGIFGNYVEQFGPEGAAQAWFAGPGSVGAPGAENRSDSLGTTVSSYVDRFRNATGSAPTAAQPAPARVAQAPSYDIGALLGLASDPWANDVQRQIATSLIEQQMTPPPAAEYDWMTLPDGTVVRTDATSGAFEPIGNFAEPQEPGFRQLTPDEIAAAGLNPESAWQTGPDGRIHEIGGSGVNVTTNIGDSLSPGWEAIDKDFADTYLSWIGGGSADTQAQLDNLSNALGLLEGGTAETGTAVSALPRELQAFVNADGLIARENVEETVQRSLRETLGAQFTEREGERLIMRAFNPLLPTEENIRRVNLLVGKIQEMATAKDAMVQHFQQNGTLMGYEGPTPSMNALLEVEAQFGTDPDNPEVPTGNQPYVDGTIIENEVGQRMIMRNGNWEMIE